MTRRTSSRRPALIAWNRALCSESTGRTVAPAAAARRMKRPPAQTRHSLLASATIPPRSAAASVGRSPAAPVIAPITHCAGPLRRFDQGAFAGSGLDAGAGQLVLELAVGGGIADRGEARADLARERRERRGVAMRAHRLDPIARRVRA